MTQTQPLTTTELLTEAQPTTNTHRFPALSPSDPSKPPLHKELPEDYKTSAARLAEPFTIYQKNLTTATPRVVRWLWEKRLPLAGITLLDGDHGCGKSLLALQIAVHVSSGTPMLDGTPTIQGGVVIVSPNTDATTQLQLLTAMGADLSRIEILSFIQEQAPQSHASGYRPFSLPEDLTHLLDAINRVNARLVIFDPFIPLLSYDCRWTDQRLSHLLADLNQRLIERNIACLLIRNCHAKGGQARPTVLERSDHFVTIALSRLLLAPDPMQPDCLLISHALSRHSALAPTPILQIQSPPDNPDLPHITIRGYHSLQARDLIENRPDTLHRRLLSQHLQSIIADVADPVPVVTLYARSPHSSPFQIQRSLNDLLNMGQIERPARGFYTPAPARPVLSSSTTTATTPIPQSASSLNSVAATTLNAQPVNILNATAATTATPEPDWEQMAQEAMVQCKALMRDNETATTSGAPHLSPFWEHFEQAFLADQEATTATPEPVKALNTTVATNIIPTSTTRQSLQWTTS